MESNNAATLEFKAKNVLVSSEKVAADVPSRHSGSQETFQAPTIVSSTNNTKSMKTETKPKSTPKKNARTMAVSETTTETTTTTTTSSTSTSPPAFQQELCLHNDWLQQFLQIFRQQTQNQIQTPHPEL